MVNGLAFLLLFSRLLTTQSFTITIALQYLQHSPIHTLMAEAAMQGANCTSGAIWGSLTCSRVLQHAAGEAGDSAIWLMDESLFLLSFSRLLTDSLLLSTGVLCPQPPEGVRVYTSTQTGHTGADHRKDAQTGCEWFYSK